MSKQEDALYGEQVHRITLQEPPAMLQWGVVLIPPTGQSIGNATTIHLLFTLTPMCIKRYSTSTPMCIKHYSTSTPMCIKRYSTSTPMCIKRYSTSRPIRFPKFCEKNDWS